MKIKLYTYYTFLMLFGIVSIPKSIFAQVREPLKDTLVQDNLGNVEDQFQQYFFEALAQKAIENHEKAITALLQCKKISSEKTIVDFELGKNYKALKEYRKAEESFKKVLKERPNDKDVLAEIYEVYYLTQDYQKAIPIAESLAQHSVNYYEDLANLYGLTQQYEKALNAIDAIDDREGYSDYREALRNKIFSEAKDPKLLEAYLKKEIEKFPDIEEHYLELMHFYATQEKIEKAYQIAEDLERRNPNSSAAHFALYKKYLTAYEDDKAIASMRIVLENTKNETLKKTIIQDLVQLVKEKPQYEPELIKILEDELAPKGESNELLGEYLAKNVESEAYNHYLNRLKNDPNNFDLLKKVLHLEIKQQKFEIALKRAENALGFFPSQPFFYYYKGVALRNLNKPNLAVDSFQEGLEYLIENKELELYFYQGMQESYRVLNNPMKVKEYQQKIEALKNKKS
ncbi:tetratricopeptide repeat protein [Mesonia ostreae]|uniref:Tetratricopeptide repeat protein n=1 Tax=Mesonia ostreae TaxID=861110 RepID=A0ABU2KIW5_9FLAO|nr:tetratricopeptide repeat protein [Mesonia ostreae]MDT0294614.1 tetratricopeptide repeat protein [Mesonia ostreae]